MSGILGGHFHFTRRSGAGTLSRRVKDATHGRKYLPAGLHAVKASYVSASSHSAFRAAIVRSVWSSKMILANTLVILNLVDDPVGVDPAFHIVCTGFRVGIWPTVRWTLLPFSACTSAAYFCCGNWFRLGWRAARLDSCCSSFP